jgi:parallel beta-helix repeat protein
MRTRRALAAFSILTPALLAIATSASAAAQTTIHIPADQPTIQAGIDAAHNGDTVLVSPGTYYENLTITGKEITLRSSSGAGATIIDGSHNQKIVVTVSQTPSLATTVDGFTIRNGSSTTTPANAGIYVYLAGATIQNNILTGNYGANIDVLLGSINAFNNVISTIAPNAGQPYCTAAEGISFFGSLNGATSNPVPDTVRGNTIYGDGTFCSGGGISADSEDFITIENNTIHDTIQGISTYPGSGAIIRQNLVYNNEQGGLSVRYELGIFPLADPPAIFVVNNTLVNNMTRLTNLNTYELQHTADVITTGADAKIALSNNLIIGYTSTSPVFACLDQGDNLATPTLLDHNDIVNLNPNAYQPYFLGPCYDVVPTEIGLDGNISANPLFASPTDFHLLSGSPAIDTGNNSALNLPAADLSGNARIADSAGLGYPVVDMGVYESSGAADAVPISLSLTSSSYYVTAGGSITLTAAPGSSSVVPAGQVTFYQNDVPIAIVPTAAGATASLPLANLVPGLYRLRATFSSSPGFAPAVSTVIYVRVNLYIPILTFSSNINPSLLSQPVVFTATIQSPDGALLGPLSISDNGTVLATLTPSSSGIAPFTTSALSLGNHNMKVDYAGDSIHAQASSSFFQFVLAGYSTATTLTSSANPATYGQSVTFTATVTNTSVTPGAPTGSVTVSDGSTILGTQSLTASGANSATATFSSSSLSVGTHLITATYTPSGTFAGSTGSISQVITGFATTTTLTSSLNPASVAQPVTYTAIVTNISTTPGAPTGSIILTDSVGFVLGTQPASAIGANTAAASFTISAQSAGSTTITATYKPIVGSGGFDASSSAPLIETIDALPSATTLIATPSPALFGTPVTLTAAVTHPLLVLAQGNLTFYDGATPLAVVALDVTGHASFITTALAVGTHTLRATYSGDGIYSASTSVLFTEVIQPIPQDFTITLASPTITIQSQHHTTTTLTLTSINGFADSLAITCANLPQYVTCQPKPTPASLTANGSVTVSLYLDTDSVLRYARLTAPPRPAPASLGNRSAPIALALLFAPFSLFSTLALSRKSRRVPLRLLALLLALLPISAALSGCTTIIDAYDPPAAAVPGTYTIRITATGAATHSSHTANLTLTITP